MTIATTRATDERRAAPNVDDPGAATRVSTTVGIERILRAQAEASPPSRRWSQESPTAGDHCCCASQIFSTSLSSDCWQRSTAPVRSASVDIPYENGSYSYESRGNPAPLMQAANRSTVSCHSASVTTPSAAAACCAAEGLAGAGVVNH